MSRPAGEFELIARIRASLPSGSTGGQAAESLIKGIGDDCAITAVRSGYQLLSTVDALVEDVHFRRSCITPQQLGHKAMAVNLSDIAAMGGIPRHALVSLCIPHDIDQDYIDALYLGMNEMASSAGAAIIGGNISSSPRGLIINVVLLGEVEEGRALLRSGARPGDVLMVTGELGLSAAGVELLNSGRTATEAGAALQESLRKHLTPAPRLAEGRRLLESGCVTAAIDISDGLASDLRHVCNESGVGAIIYSERLPVAGALASLRHLLSQPVINYALFGGEEYELLIAVGEEKLNQLKSNWAGGLAPLTEVGAITERGKGMNLVDGEGKSSELPPAGWDHLKPNRPAH